MIEVRAQTDGRTGRGAAVGRQAGWLTDSQKGFSEGHTRRHTERGQSAVYLDRRVQDRLTLAIRKVRRTEYSVAK